MIFELPSSEIQRKIESRDVSIGFVGLGRVGLPLAATLAGQGFKVQGVDIKPDLVAALNAGRSPYPDESGLAELMHEVVAAGRFTAGGRIADVNSCDVIIVAVPTLIKGEEPDIDAVVKVAADLASDFTPGRLVILQSTVPPFTTEKVLGGAIAARNGLTVGKDFGLAHSPERTQSPQVLHDLRSYPKIVGAGDEKSMLIAAGVYSSFAPGIVRMSSIVAAEVEKVIENTYRDVNIALANELARLCDLYGLDVYELIAASNSQPFSHWLSPGLVGGHCIPMDPYYIISDASGRGAAPRLMQAARNLNESMFEYVADMIDKACRRVTVLGLSFKKDVRSFETSHTLKLVKLLSQRGHEVTVHDPFLDHLKFPFKTDADLYRSLEGADCIMLSTAHSEYSALDFRRVKTLMRGNLVVDVRGLYQPADVQSCGLRYRGLGRVGR